MSIYTVENFTSDITVEGYIAEFHCSDNECTRNCGTPCRHPEKVRPSLEAFGFDIAKTLSELFNIELLWGKDGKLPEYLVLVSGFFHNEYELCNIAY